LYDGFAMSFQTLLKHESAEALERLITQHLLKGAPLKVSNQSFFSPTKTKTKSVFWATPPARGVLFVDSSRS
jgi:midasin (ATPase involved in ribosome maturation)